MATFRQCQTNARASCLFLRHPLMRILLVSYEYPPVGAGAATAGGAIAKALTELGHRITVLTGRVKGSPHRYEDQGSITHRIPSLRRRLHRSHAFDTAS